MKPIVILQHEPDDPPGSMAAALCELGVPYEVRRLDLGEPVPGRPDEAAAVIVLGGAMHVTQAAEFPFLAAEVELLRRSLAEDAPLWGVCLGAQLVARAAGGTVYRRDEPEVGWTEIVKVGDDPLLAGVASPFSAFNWHRYSCAMPPGARLIAGRDDGVQAFAIGERAWATQFHPEVDAAMAPHWVRDAVKEQTQKGPGFAEQLAKDTRLRLPAYPAFCRRLVENFLLGAGLLPADEASGTL